MRPGRKYYFETSVSCLALKVWISQPAHEWVGADHLLRAHPCRELSVPVPKLTTRGAAVATSRNALDKVKY